MGTLVHPRSLRSTTWTYFSGYGSQQRLVALGTARNRLILFCVTIEVRPRLVCIRRVAWLATSWVLSINFRVIRIGIRAALVLVRVELAGLSLILRSIIRYIRYSCLVSVKPFNHIGGRARRGR